MKKIMQYSVLRYSPRQITGEQINLGIIFDAPDDNYREFRWTKKFNRLTAFDDEVDVSVVKTLLQNIKEDVEGTVLSAGVFDIEQYVKFYINDYHFEKPKKILYDDIHEIVESLNKTYFRFDYERQERPSVEDDRKMLARMISDSGVNVSRNKKLKGAYDENITYDIVTDEYKIKFFDFDNKDLTKTINTAKAWAWNGAHNSERDLLFIYRYDDIEAEENSSFKSIISILKESGAEVLDIEAGIEKLQNSSLRT